MSLPGRNEPCSCGSALKFKKCCGSCTGPAVRLPAPALLQAIRATARTTRHCMHPNAGADVCGKVIDAHTVQRARTLAALVDDKQKVLTFYQAEKGTGSPLRPWLRGWREASTFTGFCNVHDSLTFAPVETVPFEFNARNAFLVTFRVLCHELHQKTTSTRALQEHAVKVLQSLPAAAHAHMRGQLEAILAGHAKSIQELHDILKDANATLLSDDYSGWEFACLHFEGEVVLATAGVQTPTATLSGRHLQSLSDSSTISQRLYLASVTTETGSALVLAWQHGHRAPRQFVDSLLALPPTLVATYAAQFIFAFIENTYFSKKWWDTLDADAQQHLTSLAGEGNSYYTPPNYKSAPFVPWSLVEVCRVDRAAVRTSQGSA